MSEGQERSRPQVLIGVRLHVSMGPCGIKEMNQVSMRLLGGHGCFFVCGKTLLVISFQTFVALKKSSLIFIRRRGKKGKKSFFFCRHLFLPPNIFPRSQDRRAGITNNATAICPFLQERFKSSFLE